MLKIFAPKKPFLCAIVLLIKWSSQALPTFSSLPLNFLSPSLPPLSPLLKLLQSFSISDHLTIHFADIYLFLALFADINLFHEVEMEVAIKVRGICLHKYSLLRPQARFVLCDKQIQI